VPKQVIDIEAFGYNFSGVPVLYRIFALIRESTL
jgi:hypothetical protein